MALPCWKVERTAGSIMMHILILFDSSVRCAREHPCCLCGNQFKPLSLYGRRCTDDAQGNTLGVDDTVIGPCADTGKPYPLKEGKYENQTVSVGPTSTPEPEVSGKPQTAYA